MGLTIKPKASGGRGMNNGRRLGTGGGQLLAPDNSAWGVLVDMGCILLAFWLSALLCYRSSVADFFFHPDRKLFLCLVYVTLEILFLYGFEMYSIVLDKPNVTTVTLVLSGLYTFLLTALAGRILFHGWREAAYLLLGGALSLALLSAWRGLRYYDHAHGVHRRKILMIERVKQENTRVRRMKYACMSRFDAWYEYVDIEDADTVKAFIQDRFPQFDVICLMESVPLPIRDIFMSEALHSGKDIYIVPAMHEMSFSKLKLALFDDVMVFHLVPYRMMSRTQAVVKRTCDILLSTAGLAVAALPMLVIALLVKCTSPGPILYKQVRLTKGKREFKIYKFRSMVQNAEKTTGPVLAGKDDPRVTKVGKILRALRLDELPQLINIFKGDMSVVGPRPERPYFVEKYSKEIENYDKRFMVRAGLTALSHVYGRYSTDIIDRTRYDLMYILNYSLALDIKIMLLTSRTMFLKEAAEGVAGDAAKPAGGYGQPTEGGGGQW